MWLFTKYGFYSIVRKSRDEYHVRARVKKDLENLLDAVGLVKKIFNSDDADYRFRIVVGGDTYVRIMDILTHSIDYDNFKSRIAMSDDQRPKLHAYHRIWEIMRREQDGDSGEKETL